MAVTLHVFFRGGCGIPVFHSNFHFLIFNACRKRCVYTRKSKWMINFFVSYVLIWIYVILRRFEMENITIDGAVRVFFQFSFFPWFFHIAWRSVWIVNTNIYAKRSEKKNQPTNGIQRCDDWNFKTITNSSISMRCYKFHGLTLIIRTDLLRVQDYGHSETKWTEWIILLTSTMTVDWMKQQNKLFTIIRKRKEEEEDKNELSYSLSIASWFLWFRNESIQC